jgi:hypothetical protein
MPTSAFTVFLTRGGLGNGDFVTIRPASRAGSWRSTGSGRASAFGCLPSRPVSATLAHDNESMHNNDYILHNCGDILMGR